MRREADISAANPNIGDYKRYIDDRPVFRQFFCPGCGALIENEIARADDDVLRDIELKCASLEMREPHALTRSSLTRGGAVDRLRRIAVRPRFHITERAANRRRMDGRRRFHEEDGCRRRAIPQSTQRPLRCALVRVEMGRIGLCVAPHGLYRGRPARLPPVAELLHAADRRQGRRSSPWTTTPRRTARARPRGSSGTRCSSPSARRCSSFVLGTALAWMNERTNTPFKALFFALSIIPLIIPGHPLHRRVDPARQPQDRHHQPRAARAGLGTREAARSTSIRCGE